MKVTLDFLKDSSMEDLEPLESVVSLTRRKVGWPCFELASTMNFPR